MTVLVTGGGGYIGSHMVWALVDAGEDVAVLDRLSTGFRWAIAPEAKFYEGDIADEALLDRICQENDINAIIHFAGSIIVPESVADPLTYYENNTVKSRALIAGAIRNGIRHFVFSSTAAVYGTPEGTEPVTESARLNPESPYGSAKLMTEIMLRDASIAHDFTYTALRYFNVAGADPRLRTGQSTVGATHLIKVAGEAALGKRTHIDVFGTDYPTTDGTCVRDYIHVTDLIAAHALLLKHLRKGGASTTLNCAYGQGYSVRQVVETVRDVSGVDLRADEGPRRAGDPASITATGEKVRNLLGWIPQHDNLREIVKTAYEWERHLMTRNR